MPTLVECWTAAILRRRYNVRFLPRQVLTRGARQLEREFGAVSGGKASSQRNSASDRRLGAHSAPREREL